MGVSNKFWTFGKGKFALGKFVGKELKDNRNQPIIKMGKIVEVVIEMVPLSEKSLLEVGKRGRLPSVRERYKTSRKMVVSDTTITRVLPSLDLSEVRHYIYRQIEKITKEDNLIFFKLQSGRKLRVGAIDGTVFGSLEGSVLAILGNMNLAIDFERSPGRGNELTTSKILLKRAEEELGKGFFDVIVGDGLYFTEEITKIVKDDLEAEILIKTNEERLELIKDTKGLIELGDTEQIEGIGYDRTMGERGKYRLIIL